MKKYISLALLVLGATYSFGQSSGEWCATDQRIQEQFAADPSLQEMFHQQMMAASQYRHNGEGNRATITVPVVVHIIHDNGAGNISAEQIQDRKSVV